MTITVAVVAAGEMGAGIGGRLSARGARVVTALAGRSAASAERAKKAGMTPIDSDTELVAQAEFILSIVPPGDAVTFAQRLAPAMKAAARKPIFVDCNAVSPNTAQEVGTIVAETGSRYVDAGIVGGPPAGNSPGPRLYASGEAAGEFGRLSDYGIDVRVLQAPVGAASALKMSYAGITKGLSAIGCAMALSAARAGVADALRAELAHSQPEVLDVLSGNVPRMFPKAYRFIAEMREIAAYSTSASGAPDMYGGAAQLYERIAECFFGERSPRDEISLLAQFFAQEDDKPRRLK